MNFSISTLCFSTLLAAALSSCTNEIQSLMDADRAVTFTTATPHRATGTTWEAGDAIGVFMAASGETVGTDAAVRYETPSGDGNFSSASPLYFPSDGSAVDFVAYYPYDATLSGTTYKVNVSDQSEPAKIDLMRADNLRGLSLTNRTARLDFDHELATLTLRLTATDGTVLNGLTATLEDVATQADFDLTTGTFSTPTATADVAMLVTTESTTSATATALLIPGTYAEGLKVTLRLGDKVQTVAPSLTQIEGGKDYTFNLNVTGGSGAATGEATYFKRTETPLITNAQLEQDNLHYIVHMMASDPSVRNYAMLYDSDLKIAYWVAYPLCGYYTNGDGSRTDDWQFDPSLSQELQANLRRGFNGYDRGHQIPSADRVRTNADNATTFYYTNMTPQLGQGLNQSIWANLEDRVRGWSSGTDTLFVVTGAMPTTPTDQQITYVSDNDGRNVAVPKYYFKALARRIGGQFYTIAFKLDQRRYDNPQGYMDCAMSVSDLEALTGFTFFPTLDASVKQTLDLSRWQ